MEIGLKAPDPVTDNFALPVTVGNLAFLRSWSQGLRWRMGKVSREMSIEDANKAARLTGLSLLSSFKAEIG